MKIHEEIAVILGTVDKKRGARVVAAMKIANCKIVELSTTYGISERTVTRWRTGNAIKYEYGVKLCNRANISLSYLAYGLPFPSDNFNDYRIQPLLEPDKTLFKSDISNFAPKNTGAIPNDGGAKYIEVHHISVIQRMRKAEGLKSAYIANRIVNHRLLKVPAIPLHEGALIDDTPVDKYEAQVLGALSAFSPQKLLEVLSDVLVLTSD